jgi:hypothetical protein
MKMCWNGLGEKLKRSVSNNECSSEFGAMAQILSKEVFNKFRHNEVLPSDDEEPCDVVSDEER